MCERLLFCAFHPLTLTWTPWQCFPYMHTTQRPTCAETLRTEQVSNHIITGAQQFHKHEKNGQLDVPAWAKVKTLCFLLSTALSGRVAWFIHLRRDGWRSPFTGEDGSRSGEGRRARHSTVHSGHIIMTFTRPELDRYSVIRVWEKVIRTVWVRWDECTGQA